MSDTQRDREERQHVIKVLQNMVDWMEAANYIVAKPERIHALDYAIASIKTDLRYDLLYEETSGQADKPTTKDYLGVDYLGVDCISRSDVLKLMQDNWHTHNGDWAMQESMDDIRALPAVTPQEPRKGHWIEHPRTKELRFHHIYECSACKTQIIGNRYNVGNYKYCPHCGIEFEVEE